MPDAAITGLAPRDTKTGKGRDASQTSAQREAGPNPFPGSRLARLTLEGEWELVEAPTREELTKHAKRFGCNQVAETAVQVGFGLEDTAQLIAVMDTIATEHSANHKDKTWWQGFRLRKMSADDYALKLHGRKKCDDCRAKQGKVENCETCGGLGHVLRADAQKEEVHEDYPERDPWHDGEDEDSDTLSADDGDTEPS